MYALGVDTSNYATSLAVVDSTAKEVVCALKRLLPVPQGGLGLRQSDAVFQHIKALPQMLSELESLFPLHEINHACVSNKPREAEGSYMPCFLAGVAAAQAFALGRGIPLYTISHQQGHLAAALFGTGKPELALREVIFFHFSGGTSEMLLVRGTRVLRRLGGSLDLYAGQAIDRLGVRLGLPFPAGVQLSALATECDAEISPKVSVNGMDCHFSGLQNQCERLLEEGRENAYVARYCLRAVAKTAQCMLAAARRQYPGLPCVMGGGVMSSTIIRDYAFLNNEDTYFVPPELSADNAVGVALIAEKTGRNI